jgi:hypothetical protein
MTDISLDTHRARTGFLREDKFRKDNDLPRYTFKSLGFRDELGVTIARISAHVARLNNWNPVLLRKFVTSFMADGLMYLQLSKRMQDGDVLEEFIIDKFAREQGHLSSSRLMLVEDVQYWKTISKKYGAFLVPRNNILSKGMIEVVHHIPKHQLRKASINKINSLFRKKPSSSSSPPEKLSGGGNYGYYSCLATLEGGGRSFENRRHKSVNAVRTSRAVKGKGGRNKSNKINRPNCDPPPRAAEEGHEEDDIIHYGEVDTILSNFVGAGNGGLGDTDAVFSSMEVSNILPNIESLGTPGITHILSGMKVVDRDLYGAPFCGMTCVDVAARIRVEPAKYADRVGQTFTKDKKRVFTQDVIDAVGTTDYLIPYAQSRGLGLVFLMREGNNYRFHSLSRTGTGKYAVLVHSHDILNGHWTLLSKCHSDINHMRLEGLFESPDKGCKYLGYGECLEFGDITPRPNNTDVRSYIDQRDGIKLQGQNQLAHSWKSLFLLGRAFEIPFTREVRNIDATRSHSIAKQLAFTRSKEDVDDALSGLMLGREVNSEVDPVLMADTAKVLHKYANKIHKNSTATVTEGLVCVNMPSSTSIIPDIEVIEENQLDGLAGGGVNHVVVPTWRTSEGCEGTWRDVDPSKLDRPVAVAPIGCPVEEGRAVGPGLISLTDEKGLLASFCGRSMSKRRVERGSMTNGFLRESKAFMDHYIDNTSLDMISPEDSTLKGIIAQFKKTNQGKKSAKWIDRRVKNFIEYNLGKMSAKTSARYVRHGCFVKFESNIKRKDGKLFVRPRLIMTMSEFMQFSLCYLSEISDVWYDGPIECFQVKHMNPSAMISKIREAQDRLHCVTDYSAFESSINSDIRELEMYVVRRLCSRAGYVYTLRMLNKLNIDLKRTLQTKGLSFVIESRCSGDYWTSMGNGIVSICLMKYCHSRGELSGEVFSMLAEGDGGLVPLSTPDVNILNSLGFKFSSETSGTRPGDTDFLRSLWDHRRWLNIGRVLSRIFWVKKGIHLRKSKQKFLLRTMALSLHYLSPGHPVLWAVVKRIEQETRGMNCFKSASLYLDNWKDWDLSGRFPDITVDESMRARVAEGADGFPPLPILIQKILERKILSGDYNFRGLLNDYGDYKDHVDSSRGELLNFDQSGMEKIHTVLHLPYKADDLSTYREQGTLRTPSQWRKRLQTLNSDCKFVNM